MSVIDSFQPITRSCGLVEAQIEAVAEAVIRVLEDWDLKLLPLSGLGELQAPTSHETVRVERDLQYALQSLDPLSVHIVTRHLLMETKAGWTAYFNNSNLVDGNRQLVRDVSAELHVKAIYVKEQENTEQRFGAFVFQFHDDGRRLRIIENTIQDRGWDFDQGGEPLPFENTAQYAARKKADRFNRQMLRAYLRELGLRPFDDDFYVVDREHPARLISRIDRDERLKSRIQSVSLSEVRAKDGLDTAAGIPPIAKPRGESPNVPLPAKPQPQF